MMAPAVQITLHAVVITAVPKTRVAAEAETAVMRGKVAVARSAALGNAVHLAHVVPEDIGAAPVEGRSKVISNLISFVYCLIYIANRLLNDKRKESIYVILLDINATLTASKSKIRSNALLSNFGCT